MPPASDWSASSRLLASDWSASLRNSSIDQSESSRKPAPDWSSSSVSGTAILDILRRVDAAHPDKDR